MKRRGGWTGGHIACWNCNGNGLDPAKFFNWSEKRNENDLPPPSADR